jgi:hypothetical protein
VALSVAEIFEVPKDFRRSACAWKREATTTTDTKTEGGSQEMWMPPFGMGRVVGVERKKGQETGQQEAKERR